MKRPAAAMDAAAAEPEPAAAAGPAEAVQLQLGTVNVLLKLPIVLLTASLVHFL